MESTQKPATKSKMKESDLTSLEKMAIISCSFQLKICDGLSQSDEFVSFYPKGVLEITHHTANGGERTKRYEFGGDDSKDVLEKMLKFLDKKYKKQKILRRIE